MKGMYKIKLPENYVFSIYQDESAVNPREDFDQFGTIAYCHKRYILGEERLDLMELEQLSNREDIVSLPVYLYDHGGITISCKPFSCPWDSGQVGIIYATHEKIKKEYGEINEETIKKAISLMLSEIEAFNCFLTGDVYGYELTRIDTCPHCNEEKIVHIDSCWGFYGHDWENNGILENLEDTQLKIVREWLKKYSYYSKTGESI